MSPRRSFAPGAGSLLVPCEVPPRRWKLPLVTGVSAVLMVAALTAAALMLVAHESRVRAAAKDRQLLSYVDWFMGEFTSLDPFHANDYVERVTAEATGDFATAYHDKANEIVLQVARAEPTTGSVLAAGIERWNDDGSANVLVATEVTSKSPDGKQVFTNTNRWSATVVQEGNRWKISNLMQVI